MKAPACCNPSAPEGRYRSGSPRGLARLLPALLVLVQVSCFWPEQAPALQPSQSGADRIELLGTARIAGTQPDRSGMSGQLEDQTPVNQFGGVSAIDWIPGTSRFIVASDRGPKDGAVSWACRFHEIELPVQRGQDRPFSASVTRTILLHGPGGRYFSGSSSQLAPDSQFCGRLDPEGLRVAQDGSVWISDEYGPHLLRFSTSGELLQDWAVPGDFLVRVHSARAADEDSGNQSGRRSNRGMEGLALTPDGRHLVGLMQSALIQDARLNEKGNWTGLHSRIVRIDLKQGKAEQFAYRQENEKYKLHEILALDHDRYLVIEQDGESGDEARFKQIFLVNLRSATRLPEGCRLPPDSLPKGVTPVSKSLLIDLLDSRWGLGGPEMPAKIEGLSWGPVLEDGRRILVVATDNDFIAEQDSLFYIFAVPVEG